MGKLIVRDGARIDNATDFTSRGFLTLEIGGAEPPRTPVLNLPTVSGVNLRDLSVVIDYVGAWRPEEEEAFALVSAVGTTRSVAYQENISISDAEEFASYSWESVVNADSGTNDLVATVEESQRPDFGNQTISDQTYVLDAAFDETLPEVLGGTPDYSLAPASGGALPVWLIFEPATRRLSGTPTIC